MFPFNYEVAMWKVICLSLVCLIVLASCHKKSSNTIKNDYGMGRVIVDTSVVDTLSEENWQFQTYGGGWISVPTENDVIKVVLANRQFDMLLFFLKESTEDRLPDYVVGTASSFQNAGLEVDKISTTTIDHNQAAVLTVPDKSKTMWTWLIVKDGNAYVFTCVANNKPDAGTSQFDFCQGMAQTIQIK